RRTVYACPPGGRPDAFRPCHRRYAYRRHAPRLQRGHHSARACPRNRGRLSRRGRCASASQVTDVTVDTRFLAFLVWGVGTVLVYGVVLYDRVRSWHYWRDERALRSMLTAVGLFMTAVGAGASIAFVLFGEVGSGIRGLFVSIS